MSKKVAVIMGSDSDLDTMRPCIQRLKSFGIPTEVHIISAHRTPAAGVLAAYTTLPVIGVPIKTSMMGGLDSLLSMVQMPKGIPVACVAVDGADNAAILAAQMLALSDEALSDRLVQLKAGMAAEVEAKDHKIQMEEF